MELWTAFMVGLAGSLHCMGMCGPIAMALPFQEQSHWHTFLNTSLYNLGRSMSYMLIGVIPGLLGLGIFISGYQSLLSILIGVFLIAAALFSTGLSKGLSKIPAYQKMQLWLHQQFKVQLQKNTRRTFLQIGMLNGLLPCGMVYVAVAGAITQGSIINAMLYMLFFGLGTFPMMASVALSGKWMGVKFRRQLTRLYPFFLLIFGVLFLLRGWQIDLPATANYWLLSGPRPMCH